LRAEAVAAAEEQPRAAAEPAPSVPSRVTAEAEALQAELLVLGGGPGGYTAAFRAADLGKSVLLVERYPTLGGVCLNVGCIPSKALLHMAGVIEQAAALSEHGVEFGPPRLDFERIRARKDEVVATLTRGLDRLAQQRRVRVVSGVGRFTGPHELAVVQAGVETRIRFEQAVLATGSRNVTLQASRTPRLDSTRARPWGAGRLLVGG
jgi:dihydrolipoamide dehydrogenase